MPQDFSGHNLRGRSFKGKNLEGANFSYADIRGADFMQKIIITKEIPCHKVLKNNLISTCKALNLQVVL
ncbi:MULTISPECIES: pentapeptide repeat-containing protein [unclassified Nostoc]|uniref:pentapeptide repeat-containing protein n=1 Tax=Nostoc sp. UCD121 TaxID=2681305 RepID=UPI0021AB7D57|nr:MULTISPECIES: pentapeptide repeat-containing protein [unclassified Nostoc]